jgi:iron complex outermembrane receptor protein
LTKSTMILKRANLVFFTTLFSIGFSYNVLAANEIEEIVVTALKRNSTLQDTPIAISALTNQKLERIGADDFSDFVGSVPGLTLKDNGPSQTRPIIRGIASPGEGQVGVYYDNSLATSAPGTTNSAGERSSELRPFDLERIEVLKGPQGTLYGGGSMGGTIRFITNKPNAEEFEGKIKIGGSSVAKGDEGYSVDAMVNVPIIKDQLALRVVAFKRDDPGFIDNVALGLKDFNDVDAEGGRVALRWTPTDKLTVQGTIYYQDLKVGGGFHINPDLGDSPQTDALSQEPYEEEQVTYNLNLEYDFGFAEAVYSYSWFDRNAVFRFHNGFTGFPFPPVLSTQPDPLQNVTHEIRLSSSGDNMIDWTVGGFYSDRNSFVSSDVNYIDAQGLPTDVFLFKRHVNSSLLQKAVFGEATWHATDKLALTFGVRHYDVSNSSDVVNDINIPGVGLPSGTPGIVLPFQINPTRGGEKGEIFKVHGAYDFTDDLLVFASFSQGFRPGGANQNSSSSALADPGVTGAPVDFKSDKLDSFELGVRSQWMDGRLTLNGSIYHIKWKDIVLGARSPTGLFAFLLNADKATATGFELEGIAELAEDFRLTTAISYVNAELAADAPINVAGGNSRSGLDGDRIPNVPEFTINASMEYGRDLPWFGGVRGYGYINVDYTGDSFSDFNPFLIDIPTLTPTTVVNDVYARQGDYVIVDLRFGLEGDKWDATVYVENVLDDRAITNVFVGAPFRPSPGQNFIERPRTIGVSFSRDF